MELRTKRAGVTFIESLVAVIIIGVALFGMVNLFGFSMTMTQKTTNAGLAYAVARDTVEQIRAQGFYHAGPSGQDGTSTVYYSSTGVGPSNTQGSNEFKVVTVITSDKTLSVAPFFADDAIRTVTVTVTDLTKNAVVYTTGTMLARAGT